MTMPLNQLIEILLIEKARSQKLYRALCKRAQEGLSEPFVAEHQLLERPLCSVMMVTGVQSNPKTVTDSETGEQEFFSPADYGLVTRVKAQNALPRVAIEARMTLSGYQRLTDSQWRLQEYVQSIYWDEQQNAASLCFGPGWMQNCLSHKKRFARDVSAHTQFVRAFLIASYIAYGVAPPKKKVYFTWSKFTEDPANRALKMPATPVSATAASRDRP
jgi:hypothetical protein